MAIQRTDSARQLFGLKNPTPGTEEKPPEELSPQDKADVAVELAAQAITELRNLIDELSAEKESSNLSAAGAEPPPQA